jgi:hypothetical protein
MCLDIAPDKAFENVFRIKAILRLATKKRFCESSQCLIQPRPVWWSRTYFGQSNNACEGHDRDCPVSFDSFCVTEPLPRIARRGAQNATRKPHPKNNGRHCEKKPQQ